MDNIEKQRIRLTQVLDYLKSIGHSQREIAESAGYDATWLAHLKSGKIKYIPQEFLTLLHDNYHVNPQYILLNSSIMLDIMGMKLANFEKFVDSWDTVYKPKSDNSTTDKYLHLKMNKNFYNFLLEVDSARLFTEEGFSSLSEEIERIKELYNNEPEAEEYVLLPKNVFYEIVETETKKRKHFNEVIDTLQYENYIEETT